MKWGKRDMLTVMQAWLILDEMGLKTNIQTIRRWARDGTLKGGKVNRRQGFVIEKESFEQLVEKKLKEKNQRQIVYQKGYEEGFKDAKKLYEQIAKRNA